MPADQLIRFCATSGNRPAWEEFMRRYHAVITSAAIRVAQQWGGGGSDEEIDDVIQEIYLKIYADRGRLFTTFQSVHADAIFGFVKVVATNAARDFFRSKTAQKRGGNLTEPLDETADRIQQHCGLDRTVNLIEIYRMVEEHTRHENGPRDRAIFDLYYREGLTAEAISKVPGITLNPKGVEAVLHRITKAIRATVSNANPQQEIGAG
jgi:RNA polymerase sigma-70 factor (ECF subfamily)